MRPKPPRIAAPQGSGIETDVPTAAHATSREGLLSHWKDYGNPTKALEAAGLRE